MYIIYFYSDNKGNTPVLDYINKLEKETSKDGRVKFGKIMDYIGVLADKGTAAGEPYMKHIDGGIWELRPLRERVLFAAWSEENQAFVLLHHFMKQTQKTPQRDINTAKRRLQELKEGKDSE